MINFTLNIQIEKKQQEKIYHFLEKYLLLLLILLLTTSSITCFIIFYNNHLGIAYNDARSHLDIGRRVVEGLKPGLAQLGSVWLPLPHLLMVPTIWNDFMWHSGLSGALQSMISYVITGVVIYLFLKKMHIGIIGRTVGVAVFATNINILYLQSTAMTEMLLIASMTIAVYEFMLWYESYNILTLIRSSFWVMLATLNRYDGWFLFANLTFLLMLSSYRKKGYKTMEGIVILFCTLGGLGIVLWFLWNQLIFKDAFYFISGPYSAHAQQLQLSSAGVLKTKGNFMLSSQVYLLALIFNSNAFIAFLGVIGALFFYTDKTIKNSLKIASTALFAPLLFNILALYLGQSVLFIQGFTGGTWFNVRYGIMMMPAIAIFVGYLVGRMKNIRILIIALLLFVSFFTFANADAVTIDDAQVGSSQKNVSEVSGWLHTHAKDTKGFILISAASHDAIIFSSGLPMSKFIHEGTGKYWIDATQNPDRWARWIIMRTYDNNDQTYKLVSKTPGFANFTKVESYPFADIYEINPSYVKDLHTEPIITNNK